MPTIAISGRLRSSGGFSALIAASDSSFAIGGATAVCDAEGSERIHPAPATIKNASAPRMESRTTLFMAPLMPSACGRKWDRVYHNPAKGRGGEMTYDK